MRKIKLTAVDIFVIDYGKMLQLHCAKIMISYEIISNPKRCFDNFLYLILQWIFEFSHQEFLFLL
jgi:hypothetical protein